MLCSGFIHPFGILGSEDPDDIKEIFRKKEIEFESNWFVDRGLTIELIEIIKNLLHPDISKRWTI